jgi:tetratricopeptide (TPR) repeat protein
LVIGLFLWSISARTQLQQPFVFAADPANPKSVDVYTRNDLTGVLTPVPGSPFPSREEVNVMTLDFTARFLFTATHNPSKISMFTVDPNTGARQKLYEAYYFYARTSFQRGDLTKAAELYEQAAKINPDDYQAVSLLVTVYHGLGRALEAAATEKRALQLTERHIEIHTDDPRALYFGAGILARTGDQGRSLDWARRALAIDPEETSILYNVACVYALLGRSEDALSCLGKVMEHGTFYKNWAAKDSDLDSLRSDPRFHALLS